MRVNEALFWAIENFKKMKISSASLDAEVLLSFVLKKPKEFLFTYPEKKLRPDQWQRFQKLVARRNKFEPIAYLINNKQFYGLNFYVDKRVLIPRPETEILVEKIIGETKKEKNIIIADIGTGSGCIAIALAKNLPKAQIYATENSRKAIIVAKRDIRQNQAGIKLYQGNLLKPLKGLKIAYICANLPYLPASYLKKLPQKAHFQGLKYEPRQALVAGKIFKEFFKQIKQYNFKPKAIFLEIDPIKYKVIIKLANRYLPDYQIETVKSYQNQISFLIIQK